MRRNLLASTAMTTSTALLAGAAWAADLPVKALPAPVNARFSWTGCYVGVNAGGASTRIDQDFTVPGVTAFDSSGRDSSFTGGGQLGCNYQFDPNWVVGIEGDFNYLRGNRNQDFSFLFGTGEDSFGTQQTSLRWLATVRGRFGYAWDRWFLYATGGLAIGDVKSSLSGTAAGPNLPSQYAGSYSADRAGWTAGAGFEYAFAERLSAKLEYLHFDLGTANYLVNLVSGPGTVLLSTWNASAKVSGDIVRVGLNYRFTP
jgi:outer membrane immunogenic protein